MFIRLKHGGRWLPHNYSEYLCESKTDMSNIDTSSCSVGSKSFVLNGYEIYILNNTNTWVLYETSGFDPADISDYDIATVQELINYINS